MENQKKQRVEEHLHELRSRFLAWLACFLGASMVSYFFYQPLLSWLIKPLSSPLFYTSPVGALQTVFGICLLFGFMVTIPLLMYEIIKFIEPAFDIKLTFIFYYCLISLVLAVAGILIAYYLVLPATLTFLANFAGGQLQALISSQEYFSFITKYLLGFALLFQLPLVTYILSRWITLTAQVLIKYLRHVIVLSFIIAAILTPTPDPINQTIMAAPMIVLYLVSIATLAISHELLYTKQ